MGDKLRKALAYVVRFVWPALALLVAVLLYKVAETFLQ